MTNQRPVSDLFTPPVLAVVQALLPAETRAVGGAVRALLTAQPMAHVDVDLATTATPDDMLARFKAVSIPVDTQGLRWGSVVAGEGDDAVDVTTLREDKYLPGSRYPTVGFTADWHTDSLRRDFTINAIYLAPDGTVFDPHNGQADLQAGVVRFIGDPATRLAEDPLRLLRFFRFCGTYGLAGFTPELEPTLAAAVPAIKSLSRARVEAELAKLDITPHAVSVRKAMEQVGL